MKLRRNAGVEGERRKRKGERRKGASRKKVNGKGDLERKGEMGERRREGRTIKDRKKMVKVQEEQDGGERGRCRA